MKRSPKQNLELKGGESKIRFAPRNQICLVLDNIRSMHNVGAIFRTADGAGIESIYLCGITACPPRHQILKTSLGAEAHMDWKYYKSSLRLVKILKAKGYRIVSLEQTYTSIDYKLASYEKPLAIILGNEIEGVRNEVLAESHQVVEIPMKGIANSLNVATSAGIILYHLI